MFGFRSSDGGPISAPVTLLDVAREAGVHTATVSRALSRPELVNEHTLTRVLAAVEALDYHPNLAARRLRTGRTGTIGVVVPDIANPFFGAFIRELQDALRPSGQSVVLADSRHDPTTELDEVAWLRGQADAVILCGSVAPAAQLRVAAGAQPVVLVNRQIRGTRSVVVDQRAVAELSIEHLVGLGHRSIAFVAGPGHFWSSVQRRAGIEALSVRHQLDLHVVEANDATYEAGVDATHAVLASRATAVLTFNDLLAVGLLHGIRVAERRVPDDLSVVGCDGIDLARMVDPPLTTVAAPLPALAAAVVASLTDAAAPVTRRIAPNFVEGGTTKATSRQRRRSTRTTP